MKITSFDRSEKKYDNIIFSWMILSAFELLLTLISRFTQDRPKEKHLLAPAL
jgi:hypothetical protein